MDVLKAAFGVVGGTESEKRFEGVIPGIGNTGDFQLSGEERAFQFEAEEDV